MAENKEAKLRGKIHKWLSGLSSHEIYGAKGLAEEFKKKTVLEPCWPTHTVRETVAAINARGLGGTLSESARGRTAYGWEIATALAEKYGRNSEHGKYMGRGWVFRAALDSLKEE